MFLYLLQALEATNLGKKAVSDNIQHRLLLEEENRRRAQEVKLK
jgi:hypothetical protein